MTRRAAVAIVVLLAWVAGSTIGSIAALPSASARTPGIVLGRAHGGYTPDPTGRRTITILAIGSDARPGQNPLTSRADSIHVIFLHPRRQQAVVVGIPRDSFVFHPRPGHDQDQRRDVERRTVAHGADGRAELRSAHQLLGRHVVLGHHPDGRDHRRAARTGAVPDEGSLLGVELPQGLPAAPWGRGPRVRPRPTQRARRGLRSPGERRSRHRGRARAVQEGVPGEPGPAAHVDRGGRAEHGVQLARGRAHRPRVRGERDPVPERAERGAARGHGQRGRAVRGAAVDGDGAGDLR